MSLIKGYQYQTETEAQTARNFCDAYYGIPKDPTDTTTHWTNYYFAELNSPTFYYIVYDETLLVVLGQPEEFDVIVPLPN